MSNQEQRGRGFWIGLAIIFILSFLTTYALAEEPVQIPVEEDFFIGQIVNVHTGSWTTGQIVDYDPQTELYTIALSKKQYVNSNTYKFTEYIGKHVHTTERKGSQLRARSPKRKLEVLPDEPVRQNIKAEVEEIKPEIKPEFKFKKGTIVSLDIKNNPWLGEVTSTITDRAVLWGENVYRVERSRRRQPGDNGPGIWHETISEKDLQLPEKKQPEYVEGLQP